MARHLWGPLPAGVHPARPGMARAALGPPVTLLCCLQLEPRGKREVEPSPAPLTRRGDLTCGNHIRGDHGGFGPSLRQNPDCPACPGASHPWPPSPDPPPQLTEGRAPAASAQRPVDSMRGLPPRRTVTQHPVWTLHHFSGSPSAFHGASDSSNLSPSRGPSRGPSRLPCGWRSGQRWSSRGAEGFTSWAEDPGTSNRTERPHLGLRGPPGDAHLPGSLRGRGLRGGVRLAHSALRPNEQPASRRCGGRCTWSPVSSPSCHKRGLLALADSGDTGHLAAGKA